MKACILPVLLSSNSPPSAFTPHLVYDAVYLRAPRRSDYEAWVALREQSRAHLTRWEEAWRPQDVSLTAFRQRLRFYQNDMRRGGGLSLFVFRAGDNVLLGGVTLSNIRYGASCSGLMGYWVGERFLRRGYGFAAASAVINHGFSTIGLNRIEAACQPENAVSRKMLEKLGFRLEGRAQSYLRINGQWRDHDIYARIAPQQSC